MILPQVQEVEDIGMPGLDIDGEGTGTLVSTLVNISSSGIVGSEHWNDTVRIAISTGDVRAGDTVSDEFI